MPKKQAGKKAPAAKAADEPKTAKEIVYDAEPAEEVSLPANGPLADELDDIGRGVAQPGIIVAETEA